MKSFILCPDTEVSPALTLSDNGTCNEMIWENGGSINTADYNLSNLEFLCETLPAGKITDYAVSDTGCSVISEQFKNFMDDLGIVNIQYFKASVTEQEGKPAKTGYYAANITGLIDCIDRNASEMEAEPDKNGEYTIIFGIKKLVLKNNITSTGHIFRAAHFTRLILVDEFLKQKIDESSLEGIKLISPERWDGFYGEI
ncbi:MAG: hypothetical protein JW982_15740 [Spirochaetes bacterium]|nr:hypothetical protein [Spirochaetota bacterium]